MPRRQRNNCVKIITAVFAVGFVASLISTYVAVAAANLFKIQNAELSDLSTTATGAITSFDETNIVSDVTFHTLGDSAKYTVTLKNTDEKDHVIESITDDNENPYINYVYDLRPNVDNLYANNLDKILNKNVKYLNEKERKFL